MKQHTVKKGDTLGSIAGLYYSNPSLYLRIYKANPFLQGRSTGDLANEDLVYPGEILVIPGIETIPPTETPGEISELQIEIDGEIFRGWSGITIDLNLDVLADSFSIAVAYNNVEPYKNILKRFQYQATRIIFQENTILTGVIPIIEITSGDDSTSITLKGYSKTGVLGDCNLPPNQYPRKFDGLSFVQIASQLCDPFGIKVVVSDSAVEQANILYPEISIGETEKIGAFLVKIAKDRSIILTNTPAGDLFITRLVKGAEEVLSIDKPTLPERKNSAVYDGTKLFSDYFLVSSGDETNSPSNSVFRFPIKAYRPTVLKQQQSSKQNQGNKIENEAKKALAAAEVINSSIPDWVDNNDDVLLPGKVFSIKDPSLQIDSTERHVIRTVKLTSAASGGRQASFSGVLEAAVVPA